MRGFVCFMSVMFLVAGIERLPIWTSLVLLLVFGITSIKYWNKEIKVAVWNFFNKKDISHNR